MGKTKPGMFSVLKLIGLIIVICAFLYRIICTVMFFDSITDYWGNMMALFFTGFLIDIAVIAFFFTRGWATLISSGITAGLAMLLLLLDFIFWIAEVTTGLGRTMSEIGIFPLADFMCLTASILYIFGFLSIKKREKRKWNSNN